MPQCTQTPSGKADGCESNGEYYTNTQEGIAAKDREAIKRINDFVADPGPMPFRHETVKEATKYMADKLKEFDHRFGNYAQRDLYVRTA